VLVTSTAVVPIEFKVGAKKFHQLDYEQAWDYGLDLKNFHAPSHAAAIFPILCATEAPAGDRRWKPPHADGVRPPFCCSAAGLGTAIALALDEAKRGHSAFPDEKQNVPFLDPGQLHLLSIGEPRQDSRHGAREQRLPFAWRSDQQEVVAAGRVWAWRRFRLTCRRRGPSTSLSPALLRFPSQLGDWST
jgi:hypothetical protein